MNGELKGLDELRAKLRKLPAELQFRGFRSGMRTAAKVVEAAAKLNAQTQADDPETRRSIVKNTAIRFSPKDFKRRGDIVFRVGVLGGAKKPVGPGGWKVDKTGNPGGDTWYWRFLEFGNSRIRARPFMRPALEQNAETVAQVAQTEITRAIDRAVRKVGGK